MELIVGALVVLGFVAIITRFITRDETGQLRLPRIVDDSIGMWALRRITGRRLWERPWDDELVDEVGLDPTSSDPTRAALGAIAPANAADPAHAPAKVAPARVAPAGVAPTRYVAARHRKREIVASPTPVLDLRRRQQAHRKQSRAWPVRFAAFGSVMTVLAVAAVVFAVFALQSRPSAGGGPSAAPSAQQGAAASGPASPSPSATPERSASSSPSLSPSAAAPKARITGLTSTAIAGSTKRRLTLTWTLSDTQSGIRSELLQRRTDSGSWVTVALSSSSVRSASFSMPRGHLYGFRIRATDRSGNVGLFVSRSIRI